MPTFDGNQAMFNENAGNIYNALEFRRNYHAMNNGKAGVLRDNDFLCSISTTNIVVAYGSAYINDSLTLAISQYFARTVDDTASTTLAVTPNNTLLARNDLVTLRVLDTARGDASDNCAIVIETGVVVSSFARSLVLASFTVAAGANVATTLIDTRRFAGTYQGVQRCTSTTRPLVASRGEFIYETNTYKLQQYTTAATSWQPPWNMPWGLLASGVSSGNAAIGAEQDFTGMTATFTFVANRNIELRSQVVWYTTNMATPNYYQRINEGATILTVVAGTSLTFNTAFGWNQISILSHWLNPTAGSHTYKVRGAGFGGSNTGGVSAGGSILQIIDHGPSGNPA